MAEQALEYHLRHALRAWQELQKKPERRPRQQRGRNTTSPGFLNVLSKQHSHDRMSFERCCQEKVKRYLGDEFEYITAGILSPRDKKSLFRHLCGIYKGSNTLDEIACMEQHETFQPRIGNDTIVSDKEKKRFKAFIEFLVYAPGMLQSVQRPDGDIDKDKMQHAYDRFQMSNTPRKK